MSFTTIQVRLLLLLSFSSALRMRTYRSVLGQFGAFSGSPSPPSPPEEKGGDVAIEVNIYSSNDLSRQTSQSSSKEAAAVTDLDTTDILYLDADGDLYTPAPTPLSGTHDTSGGWLSVYKGKECYEKHLEVRFWFTSLKPRLLDNGTWTSPGEHGDTVDNFAIDDGWTSEWKPISTDTCIPITAELKHSRSEDIYPMTLDASGLVKASVPQPDMFLSAGDNECVSGTGPTCQIGDNINTTQDRDRNPRDVYAMINTSRIHPAFISKQITKEQMYLLSPDWQLEAIRCSRFACQVDSNRAMINRIDAMRVSCIVNEAFFLLSFFAQGTCAVSQNSRPTMMLVLEHVELNTYSWLNQTRTGLSAGFGPKTCHEHRTYKLGHYTELSDPFASYRVMQNFYWPQCTAPGALWMSIYQHRVMSFAWFQDSSTMFPIGPVGTAWIKYLVTDGCNRRPTMKLSIGLPVKYNHTASGKCSANCPITPFSVVDPGLGMRPPSTVVSKIYTCYELKMIDTPPPFDDYSGDASLDAFNYKIWQNPKAMGASDVDPSWSVLKWEAAVDSNRARLANIISEKLKIGRLINKVRTDYIREMTAAYGQYGWTAQRHARDVEDQIPGQLRVWNEENNHQEEDQLLVQAELLSNPIYFDMPYQEVFHYLHPDPFFRASTSFTGHANRPFETLQFMCLPNRASMKILLARTPNCASSLPMKDGYALKGDAQLFLSNWKPADEAENLYKVANERLFSNRWLTNDNEFLNEFGGFSSSTPMACSNQQEFSVVNFTAMQQNYVDPGFIPPTHLPPSGFENAYNPSFNFMSNFYLPTCVELISTGRSADVMEGHQSTENGYSVLESDILEMQSWVLAKTESTLISDLKIADQMAQNGEGNGETALTNTNMDKDSWKKFQRYFYGASPEHQFENTNLRNGEYHQQRNGWFASTGNQINNSVVDDLVGVRIGMDKNLEYNSSVWAYLTGQLPSADLEKHCCYECDYRFTISCAVYVLQELCCRGCLEQFDAVCLAYNQVQQIDPVNNPGMATIHPDNTQNMSTIINNWPFNWQTIQSFPASYHMKFKHR